MRVLVAGASGALGVPADVCREDPNLTPLPTDRLQAGM